VGAGVVGAGVVGAGVVGAGVVGAGVVGAGPAQLATIGTTSIRARQTLPSKINNFFLVISISFQELRRLVILIYFIFSPPWETTLSAKIL